MITWRAKREKNYKHWWFHSEKFLIAYIDHLKRTVKKEYDNSGYEKYKKFKFDRIKI